MRSMPTRTTRRPSVEGVDLSPQPAAAAKVLIAPSNAERRLRDEAAGRSVCAQHLRGGVIDIER
jgi:hypothetical protein